jgi:DNA invertase Pin-like site-specific DNA recombinase
MAEHIGKHKRACGYCRTSGEAQRDNTSIPNQQDDIAKYIQSQGWTFTRHYVDECKSGAKIVGRDDFQQMMRDAANGKHDVVVAFDMTRFSRDGLDMIQSATTLKRDFGVDVVDTKGRFTTMDRRRTITNFVDAGIAEDERLRILERTKRGKIRKIKETGAPMTPRWPYGRIWDAETERWSIDPAKHAIVKDAARRYLRGEPLAKVAKEHGINHAFLHKTLTQRCGPVWMQRVRCHELEIDESIETHVPALLPEDIITAIKAKAEANKTLDRSHLKYKYLLAHVVFCDHCGRPMFGQCNDKTNRYYRHGHRKLERFKACTMPRSWVEASALELVVLTRLFDVFGNPAKVQQAIDEATPNRQRLEAERERQQHLQAERDRISGQRERIIDAIADDRISTADSRKKLDALKERDQHLADELDKLVQLLANIPSAEQVKEVAEQIAGNFKRRVRVPSHKLIANLANRHFEAMTWEEQRNLIQMIFRGKDASGKRYGVYISWIAGQEKKRKKEWCFRIVGRLAFTTSGRVPTMPTLPDNEDFSGAPLQNELLEDAKQRETRSPTF